MKERMFSFIGADTGKWLVKRMETITGDPLPLVHAIDLISGPDAFVDRQVLWTLSGMTSNERYATREEKNRLVAVQEGLGRPVATAAALIPIRKTAAWWALTQDERRCVVEDQSQHIRTGLRYLPAIARRLHHCRDISDNEPFDFLTWFEYAPTDEPAFNRLVAELRNSPEWRYVDREIDIRLDRGATEIQ